MDGLCFDDLDEFGRELDDPMQELVQDVIHGLIETFGSNPDALTRGVGLVAALSGSADRIPGIKAQAEAQLRDDERISNATVNITPTDTRGAYRIDLVLEVSGATIDASLLADQTGAIRRLA
jgi:hypothetical protein